MDAGGVGAKGSRRAAVSEGLARNDHAARARQNRAVLAPAAGVKSCGGAAGPTGPVSPAIRKATVATELGSPGRTRHKPSNHCAGKAGRFRLRLCFLCASLRISSAQRPWVPAGTRSSLRPLSGKRVRRRAKLGRNAPRECEVACIVWNPLVDCADASNESQTLQRVIARSEATKQSRLSPRRHSGLLRFARNDGERPRSSPSPSC